MMVVMAAVIIVTKAVMMVTAFMGSVLALMFSVHATEEDPTAMGQGRIGRVHGVPIRFVENFLVRVIECFLARFLSILESKSASSSLKALGNGKRFDRSFSQMSLSSR